MTLPAAPLYFKWFGDIAIYYSHNIKVSAFLHAKYYFDPFPNVLPKIKELKRSHNKVQDDAVECLFKIYQQYDARQVILLHE